MIAIYPFPVEIKGEASVFCLAKYRAGFTRFESLIRGQAVIEHIAHLFTLIRLICELPDNMTFAHIAAKVIGVKHHALLPEMKARLAARHAVFSVVDGDENTVIE